MTVAPGEPVDAVAQRVEASSFPFALVASADGTVLGRLPGSVIERSAGKLAGDVMEPGPSTVRADVTASELLERLRSRDLRFAIVTTPEGRLIGIARRDDLEQLVS